MAESYAERDRDSLISELEALELQNARLRAALARSNAEFEQLAHAASHDLREPLRAIAGFTQILADRYRGQLDADAGFLMKDIVEGVGRMKALIDGLVELGRVRAPQSSAEPIDAAESVAQALGSLGVSLPAPDVRITVEPLPIVKADRVQLVRLFQNLIGNALKYRRPPSVEVVVSSVSIPDGHEFRVRDSGIGIESRYFERIFGVFQRLHTREEYPGTGIGLAVCRKIVENHGGHIWVDSVPGVGSTFHFTLPG